jgi:hypothetical protein
MHLIAPPVEPTELPINMARTKIHWGKAGHNTKFAVAYPVVVIIEATWNIENRKASPKES